jgi:hypothetical protein
MDGHYYASLQTSGPDHRQSFGFPQQIRNPTFSNPYARTDKLSIFAQTRPRHRFKAQSEREALDIKQTKQGRAFIYIIYQ